MKMKHPINGDLEKLILAGCKVIKTGSVNYDLVGNDITQVLVECPKNFRRGEHEGRGALRYITLELLSVNDQWFEATLFYSTRPHAVRRFHERLAENRRNSNRTVNQ